jgi:zeaxanthin glucosyltransferase
MRKRIIVFMVMHGTSIINASFKLAKDLENNGDEVRYVGLSDMEEIVRENGYDFNPIFQNIIPAGSAETYGLADLSQLGLFGYIKALPKRIKLFRSFVKYFISGGDEELISLLRNINPDLIVYCRGQRYLEWAAIMASSLGIPGVYLRAALDPCESSGLPPIHSEIIPHERSIFERLRIRLEWKKKRLFDQINFPEFEIHTRKLAEKYGLTSCCHDTADHGKDIVVALPELFATHPEFELPSVTVAGRYYIGPLVYRERLQPGFPWENIDHSRPLIYCAFGTLIWFKKYESLYRTILDTAAQLPDWQWIIATGDSIETKYFDVIPDNALLVKTAPQIDILKAANIMITHGGTSSINECILNGVPMIVLPLGEDQYGNSARILYYGIGVRGNVNKLSVSHLTSLIKTVNRSAYIRSQITLMQKRFIEMENKKPGIAILESLIK